MPMTENAALRKDRNAGKGPMQHRHFATIAACLRNMDADIATVRKWADELAPTNPKFDRERFIRACREDT